MIILDEHKYFEMLLLISNMYHNFYNNITTDDEKNALNILDLYNFNYNNNNEF